MQLHRHSSSAHPVVLPDHAVDDGELTLDLGKKKKKKKKDAAAEPAVSTSRARVTLQQPCTCLPVYCMSAAAGDKADEGL